MITICGTSLAGVRVAAELRQAGYAGHIRTIDSDPHPPYDRPPLSKDLLGSYVRPLSADGLGNIAELADEIVTATITDVSPTHVTTDKGGFDTDVTVLALGALPRRTVPGAHVLRSRDDARALRDHLAQEKTVTIVGGGWIGCELAATLAPTHEVSLYEIRDHLLLPPISPWIEEKLTNLGVTIHLQASLPEPAGVTIDATGVIPHPLGQATDGWGRTPDGMWALGDCATWDGRFYGHWTPVLAQAWAVAHSILTAEPGTPPVIAPEVFSTIGDADIMIIGETTGTPVTVSDDNRFRCLWITDGHLIGGMVANRPADVAALRKNLGAPLDLDRAGSDEPLKKLLR